MEQKQCSKCKEWKEFKYFYKDKSKKDGFRGECKDCRKKYKKEYYEEHKSEIIKRNREYTINHKENIDKKIIRKRFIKKEIKNIKIHQ